MARHEADREDLMREATAMPERLELVRTAEEEPIFAGFRRNGAVSFYFGPDFVLQFNTAGKLRRAFSDGRLLKAEGGRLVELARERGEAEVGLRRHVLDPDAQRDWLNRADAALDALRHMLADRSFSSLRQFPAQGDVLNRLQVWLQSRGPLQVASRPHVSGS